MIKTSYGVLTGETGIEYHSNGSLKQCALEEECALNTQFGILVPKYEVDEARTKNRNSVEFYDTGVLKSIYLQHKTAIPTSIGQIEAELVTFYENGAIHRIFPLFGQVSGFWSEEEEKKLAQNITINMPTVYLENKISCICFYMNGAIKSISLYSGETVTAFNNEVEYKARIGIAFYESGRIKSLEPATNSVVKTPIGVIFAYNNDPMGIHGDDNSLKFNEDGSIKKVTTVASYIEIKDKKGVITEVKAMKKPSMLELDKYVIVPIAIEFYEEKIEVTDSDKCKKCYAYADYNISSAYNEEYQFENTCTDCAGCSGCS
ncbi:MAG: hypothetical protein VB018_04185 [Lachnospiraceae bacterium]|nr:hypothetical protein [Lachnospiraceae bacterium]